MIPPHLAHRATEWRHLYLMSQAAKKGLSHRHPASVSDFAITLGLVLALLWVWEDPGPWAQVGGWDGGASLGPSQVTVSLGSLGQSVSGCSQLWRKCSRSVFEVMPHIALYEQTF